MDELTVKRKYDLLKPNLNERTRRLWAAAEAKSLGRGGISLVARATGMERHRITRGIAELESVEQLDPKRIRRPGAGKKRAADKDKTLVKDLEALIEPAARGDPQSPLRWTSKSVRTLANELRAKGHEASQFLVFTLLHRMGYSLQANKKTTEGRNHPDRNAQFECVSSKVTLQQQGGNPAISVDAKKKELVGSFKNPGTVWRKKGDPEKVNIHDFPHLGEGKACPYGVYDLARNKGWVSVGIDHDTAAFAVESIRQWWKIMGKNAYPHAKSLLITADAGGSNGARSRLWKRELQALANELGIPISVCHFPPGTSKWNKIEHRLFSFITKNWRGRPLISHAVMVSLIAATRTETGLTVQCRLDRRTYPTGIKVTDAEMERVNITRDAFHGEWNYTIRPNR